MHIFKINSQKFKILFYNTLNFNQKFVFQLKYYIIFLFENYLS